MLGKPIALVVTSAAVTRLSHGRIRPPVGWAAVLGTGTIAGIGFTVALLIADRAFTGAELAEAKLGVLSAAVLAAALTWLVYGLTSLSSPAKRTRALQGDVRLIQDLIPEVDLERDHLGGPHDASITIIEFGDFECPTAARPNRWPVTCSPTPTFGFVWRRLPLTDVHPAAQLAAEAAEAAAAQGKFWEMHDLLLDRQENLRPADLVQYAADLDLDVDRFHDDLERHVHDKRVAQDVESADVSGATGTPPSSSTDSGTTAPTTSTHWQLRSPPPASYFNASGGTPPESPIDRPRSWRPSHRCRERAERAVRRGAGRSASTTSSRSQGLSSGSSGSDLGGKHPDLRAEAFARGGVEGGQQAGLCGLEAVIESSEELGSLSGGHDATGAAVGRIGPAFDQADGFEVVEEIGHDRAVDSEVLGERELAADSALRGGGEHW